jgi:hypothetical protein
MSMRIRDEKEYNTLNKLRRDFLDEIIAPHQKGKKLGLEYKAHILIAAFMKNAKVPDEQLREDQ